MDRDTQDLCFRPAIELARAIRSRELSAREVLEAHLEKVEQLNSSVNAIVTFVPERAMASAAAADERLARREEVGILHGLPVAHKDLALTAGVRTTMGSAIFADWVPDASSLIVERMWAAGAVMVGKTNTAEFGAGSQTFNTVFGATRNPYDLTKTCGGSSGGAAVALACGMVALADGSDMGGSLRNPASFCNVVGLRPSPGRVPTWPTQDPWSPLGVEGPMARSVSDVALFLQAVAGPDVRCPLSIDEPPSTLAANLEADVRGMRVAWTDDLGGLPVDRRVAEGLAPARAVLEDLGCQVIEAAPDLPDAREVFQTLRAQQFEIALGLLLDRHRELMKDTVVWNIEEARRRTAADLAEATRRHAGIVGLAHDFMQGFDVLALPVSQLPPFDVEIEWVREIEGMAMETYVDWMRTCTDVTLTGLPAISVPAGFTADGLPVGLQLVGRPRQDLALLRFAHMFEQATRVGERRPPIAV